MARSAVSADDPVVDSYGQHSGKEVVHSRDARNIESVRQISPEGAPPSTENSGKLNHCDVGHVDFPEDSGDEAVRDLASGALAAARAIAGRGGPSSGLRGRRRNPNVPARYSGARPDDRDPTSIGAIVGKALPELGWVAPLATARLLAQWELVVGPDIAAHCQPVSLTDGDLKVVAESTAWATQLRLMAPRILAKVTTEMPAGMVSKLVITGPSGPSWKHGPWAMRGGRGVRDTYG
jgi:predicted nucleic acid-binding Zn ribbon protein